MEQKPLWDLLGRGTGTGSEHAPAMDSGKTFTTHIEERGIGLTFDILGIQKIRKNLAVKSRLEQRMWSRAALPEVLTTKSLHAVCHPQVGMRTFNRFLYIYINYFTLWAPAWELVFTPSWNALPGHQPTAERSYSINLVMHYHCWKHRHALYTIMLSGEAFPCSEAATWPP